MSTTQIEAAVRHDDNPRQRPERIGFLVLGMHRSGTSALTRVLNLLGCTLPDQLLPGNPTNPAGHWETQAIVDLNDALIEAAGSAWDDWQALNVGWEESPARSQFLGKAVQVLRSEYGDSSFFVIKDPRICRMAPFWTEVLHNEGVDPRIIIPIRNPIEVVASLARRDGMDPSVGYLTWLRHVIDAERGTRGLPRVFVSYHALLEDWSAVAAHIASTLDICWPRYSARVANEIEDFLDRQLQHHKQKDPGSLAGSSVPSWVRQAYDIFLRWTDRESASDFAELDKISYHLGEAADAFGNPILQLQLARVHRREAEERIAFLGDTQKRVQEVEDDLESLKTEFDQVLARALGAENGVVERDAVIADLQGAHQQISQVQQNLEVALNRTASAEAELAQKSSEHATAVGDLKEAHERLSRMQGELDAGLARVASTEAALDARSREYVAALATAESRYKSLQEELDTAFDLAASLKRELRQQTDEHDYAVHELKIIQDRCASALADREVALKQLALAEQALRQQGEERAEALARAAETHSALLQRKEELRQTWAELEAERDRAQALDADLARRDMLLENADQKLVHAQGRIADLEAECERNRQEIGRWRSLIEREKSQTGQLDDARKEVDSLRAALAVTKDSLAHADKENAESKDRLSAVEAELEKTNKLARMAVSQRSQAFSEMAVVTQLLRDSEQEVLRVGDSVQWLRQMYTVILRRPRWWFFLSRKKQFERLRRRAERRGLFDSDAYLTKNPDVAATGVDPLKHYITHGIIESRSR